MTTTGKQTTPRDLRFGGWDFIKKSGNQEIWGKNSGQRLLYDPETGKIVKQYDEGEEEK